MTDGENKTGYKKPPKSGQFKKGQSGNPKGRPKGSRNLATDLEQEMSSKISVRVDGKEKKMSKQKAMLMTLSAKALKGDPRALETIIKMTERLINDHEEEEQEAPLSTSDEAIIQMYLNKQTHDATTSKKENNDD